MESPRTRRRDKAPAATLMQPAPPAKEETGAERLYAGPKRWASSWGHLSRKLVARSCPRSQERSEGRATPSRRRGPKPPAQRYSKAEMSGLRQ